LTIELRMLVGSAVLGLVHIIAASHAVSLPPGGHGAQMRTAFTLQANFSAVSKQASRSNESPLRGSNPAVRSRSRERLLSA
jgi:hypothetical protein